MIDIEYIVSCLKPIISKLPITMYMTISATVIALAVGILFSIIIKSKIFIFSKLIHVINSFLKGVPVLVILYVLYYSMPVVLEAFGAKFGIEYDIKNPPKTSLV